MNKCIQLERIFQVKGKLDLLTSWFNQHKETTRDNINSQIDKKLETKDLKDYFEFKDQLSSVNAKLDCLRREIC